MKLGAEQVPARRGKPGSASRPRFEAFEAAVQEVCKVAICCNTRKKQEEVPGWRLSDVPMETRQA